MNRPSLLVVLLLGCAWGGSAALGPTAWAQAPASPTTLQTTQTGLQTAAELLESARRAADEARGSSRAASDDPAWTRAYSLAEAALELEPANLVALRFLAESYGQLGWWSRAWDRWRSYRLVGGELDAEALEGLARAGRQLALARAQAGLEAEAVAYYRAVLDLHPDDEGSYAGLARLYLAQNRPDLAAPYLEAVRSFAGAAAPEATPPAASPGGGSAAFQAGLALYAQGEAYAARLAFIAATEADPSHAEAWAWLGRCRLEQASFALAADAYARALELAPDNPQYRDALAEAERRAR